MPRDIALVTTWGQSVRGREAKSLEVFMDALTFWGKQAADGKCLQPEAFYADDESNGMLIVKGKSDGLREIQESDEYQKLIAKAQLIVDDLKIHTYTTGDEEIQRGMRIYSEAASELGYM